MPLLAVVVAVLAIGTAVGVVLTRHHPNSKAAARTRALLAAKRARRRARIANTPVAIRGPLPGALLIADRGNNRIILVDSHRRILWRFPTSHDRRLGRQLVFDDDTFVEPGGKALISNEEDHQDIVSIDIQTHAVTRLYGTPGVKGGGPNRLNWPDDAYVLPNGTMTVADAYNCRILFVRNHRIVRQIGRTGVCAHDPPRTLGSVNGDTPLPGGGVLVSEINGSWIDNFNARGKLRWSFQAPVAYPSDPQPLSGGRILLADYASPGAAVIVNRRGEVLWRYRPTSGWGVLNHPSLAIMLPNGDIAVNDDFNDRVVVIDPHTRRIVWFYGHRGAPGRGAGFLHIPDGMDFIPLGPHEKPLWQLVHHP
jgi:hypothetical protein